MLFNAPFSNICFSWSICPDSQLRCDLINIASFIFIYFICKTLKRHRNDHPICSEAFRPFSTAPYPSLLQLTRLPNTLIFVIVGRGNVSEFDFTLEMWLYLKTVFCATFFMLKFIEHHALMKFNKLASIIHSAYRTVPETYFL